MYKKNEQKTDDVILTIHDENKNEEHFNNQDSIELTKQKEKAHYKVVHTHTKIHNIPRPRRKTRSFPIESKNNRKNSTEQNTPKKLTPPSSYEKNQRNENIQNKTKARKNSTNNTFREQKEMKEIRESKDEMSECPDEIHWDLGCIRIPKDCIVYFSQMIIIGCVISVSLYKLSTENEKLEFWASLLSGSVGYILPQPTLKKRK